MIAKASIDKLIRKAGVERVSEEESKELAKILEQEGVIEDSSAEKVYRMATTSRGVPLKYIIDHKINNKEFISLMERVQVKKK